MPVGQCAAPQNGREVELLLLSPETSPFDTLLHDFLDERIAWHEANVGYLALATVVADDLRFLMHNEESGSLYPWLRG